jgi:hypothetical protein
MRSTRRTSGGNKDETVFPSLNPIGTRLAIGKAAIAYEHLLQKSINASTATEMRSAADSFPGWWLRVPRIILEIEGALVRF